MYDTLLDQAQIMGFFGFDSVLPLALIIFAINVLVVFVACGLFLYQMYAEHGKYSARRLRHKDGSEVHAPRL